jgi:hypothetical protein
VDDHLIAGVEDDNDRLEQPCPGVEAEAEFPAGRLVIGQWFDPDGPLRGLDSILCGNSVL